MTMREPTGRVAIVTGAAQGIGSAIAERLARDDVRLVLVDLKPQPVFELVERLLAGGARAAALPGDVSRPDIAARAAALAQELFGGVDILVNNAGISPKHDGAKATLLNMSLDEWRRVLDVNLTATFLFCKAWLPSMQAKSWGRIVNMSSLAGRTRSDVPGVHYGATKSGIIGFSRLLANEVGPQGVTPSTAWRPAASSRRSPRTSARPRTAPTCRACRCAASATRRKWPPPWRIWRRTRRRS